MTHTVVKYEVRDLDLYQIFPLINLFLPFYENQVNSFGVFQLCCVCFYMQHYGFGQFNYVFVYVDCSVVYEQFYIRFSRFWWTGQQGSVHKSRVDSVVGM